MAVKSKNEGKLQKRYRDNFSGGWNAYLGVRQIKDNESPEMTNVDFIGKGGIGNRQGYTEIESPLTYTSGIKGMGSLHTASIHQLIAFKSSGGATVLSHSTDGGAWTNVTTTTFAGNLDIDFCQAAGKLYTGNGSNVMREWTGTAWADTSNGTVGYYPTYYNQRLWVVDETNADRLNFSGQYSEQLLTGGGLVNKLGDFADATAGWISFKFGSGAEITGLRVFKDSLYVFLRDSIYKIAPATAANTFTITQITNSVGCVSNRSIAQVEEDLFFAGDDGVYALGEVANYVSVRTTNKSAKIKEVFDNMTSTNKQKLTAEYFNFKYHLFYSLFGTSNDSCIGFDIRYQGWVDWRNMPANDTCVYEDSTGDRRLYIGHPTNSEVYKLYTGATDNGAAITSTWYSKSFDDEIPDIQKVYFDHTFIFGAINGTVNISVIFNDSEVSANKSLSQVTPQGGFGRDAFGVKSFGSSSNTTTIITSYRGVPVRLRASKKKFAVQYKLSTTGVWRLDNITTTFKPLSHYAFPSIYKI
jgi:hypothetical protein